MALCILPATLKGSYNPGECYCVTVGKGSSQDRSRCHQDGNAFALLRTLFFKFENSPHRVPERLPVTLTIVAQGETEFALGMNRIMTFHL